MEVKTKRVTAASGSSWLSGVSLCKAAGAATLVYTNTYSKKLLGLIT